MRTLWQLVGALRNVWLAPPVSTASLPSLFHLARFEAIILPQEHKNCPGWGPLPLIHFCSTDVLILQSRDFSHCMSEQQQSPTHDTYCFLSTTAEQINTSNFHSTPGFHMLTTKAFQLPTEEDSEIKIGKTSMKLCSAATAPPRAACPSWQRTTPSPTGIFSSAKKSGAAHIHTDILGPQWILGTCSGPRRLFHSLVDGSAADHEDSQNTFWPFKHHGIRAHKSHRSYSRALDSESHGALLRQCWDEKMRLSHPVRDSQCTWHFQFLFHLNYSAPVYRALAMAAGNAT